MKHMKRSLSAALTVLALLLTLLLSGCAGESQSPAAESPEPLSLNYVDAVYDAEAGKGKFCVYFINATKDYITDSAVTHAGDSTLLVSPDGKTMLIDMNNIANSSAIVDAMQRLGIESLDYLVLSHPHVDHIGSFAAILRYVEIKEVIKNGHDYSEESSMYQAMMNEFESRDIPVRVVSQGDSFSFGSEIEVSVMNPPADYAFEEETERANSGSLLLRFTYGQSSFLTGGDIYAGQEELLVAQYGDELQSDIVKMNHHGRDTSNSKNWINTLNCKIAVGEDNAVNSDLVEGRYRLSGAVTLYPALDGAVVVRTEGDGIYQVQLEHEREVDVYGLPTEYEGYEAGAFTVK